jgi:hypothetical protein
MYGLILLKILHSVDFHRKSGYSSSCLNPQFKKKSWHEVYPYNFHQFVSLAHFLDVIEELETTISVVKYRKFSTF